MAHIGVEDSKMTWTSVDLGVSHGRYVRTRNQSRNTSDIERRGQDSCSLECTDPHLTLGFKCTRRLYASFNATWNRAAQLLTQHVVGARRLVS